MAVGAVVVAVVVAVVGEGVVAVVVAVVGVGVGVVALEVGSNKTLREAEARKTAGAAGRK